MILDLFKKKDSALDRASREALEQAVEQRSRMDLVFEKDVTTIKGLSAAVNTVRKDLLVLDVYGLKQGGALAGKYFSCYFRIREGKAGVGFYSFRARVLEARQTANGGLAFLSSLPVRVDRAQRRKSMRVRPELSWFEAVMLWKGAKRVGPERSEAVFGLTELRQGKLCRMENMSAGGVGFHIDREFCRKSAFCPSMNDEFTVYLRFSQEVRNQPREIWLSGKVVRLVEDRVSKDLELGLEFTHLGRNSQITGQMEWPAIRDNVAEELITRVFEWHAAITRERAGVQE